MATETVLELPSIGSSHAPASCLCTDATGPAKWYFVGRATRRLVDIAHPRLHVLGCGRFVPGGKTLYGTTDERQFR